MALLFLEGFEGISGSTGSSSKNDCDIFMQRTPLFNNGHGSSNNSEPMIWSGRGAGSSICLGDDSSSDQQYVGFCPKSSLTTAIWGFAIRPGHRDERVGGTITRVNDPCNEVNGHLQIDLQEGIHLFVKAGGSTLGTVPFAVRINRWSYIEVKFTLSSSAGVVVVRINGQEVFNQTGLDTIKGSPSGDAEIGTILLRGGSGLTTDQDHNRCYDDFYVLDTTGSDNNDFLGPIKVETLLPSANGDSTDFTPNSSTNVSRVDEVVVDDDSSYNASSTATDLDLFDMEALSVVDGTVFGVQLDINAGATDATVMDLVPTIKITAEAAGDTYTIVDDTLYATYYSVFQSDPDSGAWDVTNINAMQCGYEVG